MDADWLNYHILPLLSPGSEGQRRERGAEKGERKKGRKWIV
jgi:hypothetical protein